MKKHVYGDCDLLVTYGTRPEFIKVKPLIDKLIEYKISYKILFTGQHTEIGSNVFDFRLNIKDGNNRLDSIIGSVCSDELDKIFIEINPKYVMVQGDTTSALAIAISAFNHNIKVIHLEAGLRTYDNHNPYPEEINRRLIGQISSVHFCPTELSLKNLQNELIEGLKFITGNTVIDNLLQYKKDCAYEDIVLVTMHRRENHFNIAEWFAAINNLAGLNPDLKFIIPIHPNPAVRQHKGLLTNLTVIDPLCYDDLINLLIKCKMVITDSGGLQEECSFFNKKCLVCRKVTERPESIGVTSFMVETPDKLSSTFLENIIKFDVYGDCPFGDGTSSDRICNIIIKELLKK